MSSGNLMGIGSGLGSGLGTGQGQVMGTRVASNNGPIQYLERKQNKMLKENKERERIIYWVCKFIGHKKFGMMFLSLVSSAVFLWVLLLSNGEGTTERVHTPNAGFSNYTSIRYGNNPRMHSTGYTHLPVNPCRHFAFPPPPTNKKRTGPRPCPVCYLDQKQAMALMPNAPSYSPVRNLTYIQEDSPIKTDLGGSDFGGHPSLMQRNDSYDIQQSMNVHCGFVKGPKPGRGTGFDIDDADLADMDQCSGIVVASAIFGNYDLLRQPRNVSEAAKKNVCFFMFLDEETEAAMRNASVLDGSKKVGLWRIVTVRNLPYTDARRNGKVPKLLLHRLFPNVRYSIWMDGKLELVEDPYRILERFLWRQNASFAISRHYRRFDVFDEAEANKAAAKYDNASIDAQIEFYKKEGLTPYSSDKLPITSDVPEGCLILREHVPISNLFGCLWFNEVDRFTSRDQLSFSTVRDKIRKASNWNVSMFLDCERRNFVVQGYHKDVLEEREAAKAIALAHPPPTPSRPGTRDENHSVHQRPPPRSQRGIRRNRKIAGGTGQG